MRTCAVLVIGGIMAVGLVYGSSAVQSVSGDAGENGDGDPVSSVVISECTFKDNSFSYGITSSKSKVEGYVLVRYVPGNSYEFVKLFDIPHSRVALVQNIPYPKDYPTKSRHVKPIRAIVSVYQMVHKDQKGDKAYNLVQSFMVVKE